MNNLFLDILGLFFVTPTSPFYSAVVRDILHQCQFPVSYPSYPSASLGTSKWFNPDMPASGLPNGLTLCLNLLEAPMGTPSSSAQLNEATSWVLIRQYSSSSLLDVPHFKHLKKLCSEFLSSGACRRGALHRVSFS